MAAYLSLALAAQKLLTAISFISLLFLFMGARCLLSAVLKRRHLCSFQMEAEERYSGKSGQFESVDSEGGKGPAKSVEGWIVFVQGINEEANEEGMSFCAHVSLVHGFAS